MSAQKALQGSESETRELLGGTEENSVTRQGVIDLPPRQINDFVQNGNRKNELVARPDCVYVEGVLLLANGGVTLLHLGDVGLLVGFPAVLAQPLLLKRSLFLFGQLVELALRSPWEHWRELLCFKLLLDPLKL